MQKLLIPFILLSYSFILSAQTNFQAQVIDSKTQRGLAYVNIGIVGKNIGTVSNQNGNFNITLPSNYDQDTLRLSMVSYESLEFSVSEFKKLLEKQPVVALQPTSIDLQEIVVTPKYDKTRILGNETTAKNMTGGFDVDTLGREAGIVIKLKKKYRPAYVLDFRASIAHSDYDTLRFRLNFYDLKRGKPDKKLVQENIIITSTIKSGVIEVDLREYNIVVKDDFCVTLEWIEDFGKEDLNFSISMFGPAFVFRHTSQAYWQKFNIFSPGFNVTVGY